jgi:hypothetical protein
LLNSHVGFEIVSSAILNLSLKSDNHGLEKVVEIFQTKIVLIILDDFLNKCEEVRNINSSHALVDEDDQVGNMGSDPRN